MGLTWAICPLCGQVHRGGIAHGERCEHCGHCMCGCLVNLTRLSARLDREIIGRNRERKRQAEREGGGG